MIYLGYKKNEKQDVIFSYIRDNFIKKVFILSPKKFYFDFEYEFIEWNEIIQYKTYYRLLKDIDNNTLIVVNECLRKQNRYDLAYNCIRLFLNQTKHRIIFQYLPIIDNKENFMILFDFDTRSRWKRENFNIELFKDMNVKCKSIELKLNKLFIETDERLKIKYKKKKKELFDNIGLKDPHTIPRNLYLLSGKKKLKEIYTKNNLFFNKNNRWYIGRNNRFKIKNFQTYKDNKYDKKYIVFELSHNFINFIDFLYLSEQINIDIFISDLKVDEWYWKRYNNWIKEIQNVYSIL